MYKTFKQHLLEKPITDKVSNLVMSSSTYHTYLPISPKMIERLYGKEKFKGCHIMSPIDLKNLKKMEGSKKSISVLTKLISPNFLIGGVVSGGGILVELEGNLLLSATSDIYSAVDNQGRRWLPLSERRLPKLFQQVIKLKKELTRKYFGKEFIDQIPDENRYDKKIKAKFIKDYIDGCEKILKSYKGNILKNFYVDDNLGYDEIILNNIKVLKVYGIKDALKYFDTKVAELLDESSELKEFFVKWYGYNSKWPFDIISADEGYNLINRET